MNGSFILRIEMGNEAMLREADLGEALIVTGRTILTADFLSHDHSSCTGPITDTNGNRVGTWRYITTEPAYVDDAELPGMWSNSDFTGGEGDIR